VHAPVAAGGATRAPVMAADKPPGQKPQGQTKPVQAGKTDVPEPAPRLPHERDESADSQHGEARPEMQRALDDIKAGRTDTDRGPPLNEAYQKQKTPDKPRT